MNFRALHPRLRSPARRLLGLTLLGLCACGAPSLLPSSRAAEPPPVDLLAQARAALDRGQTAEAIALADRAIELNPKNAQAYYVRGRVRESLRAHPQAVADFGKVIELNPAAASAYHWRGCEQFKLGKIKEALADFDKVIALEPAQAPYHWQRGIALYYAGRSDDGRKQFELHQKVNQSDVENAVWHFLCLARLVGADQARASLIPIQGDRRVPMAQVHLLFTGKGTPGDVLAAARAGTPPALELKERLFYAHLYLGLYYEATGNPKLSAEHITKAAGEFAQDHYMGDVARVHQKLRRLEAAAPAP